MEHKKIENCVKAKNHRRRNENSFLIIYFRVFEFSFAEKLVQLFIGRKIISRQSFLNDKKQFLQSSAHEAKHIIHLLSNI